MDKKAKLNEHIKQDHLDLISRIYELPQQPEKWPVVLEEFASTMNARMAATAVYDQAYAPYHLNAISTNIGPSFIKEQSKINAEGYQSAFAKMSENPKRAFISDMEMLELDNYEMYVQRPLIKWMNEAYNLLHGSASCLNVDKPWTDILFVMFANDRGPVTQKEKQIGNFFLDHFAKATELGRAFGVLSHRFNATLAALDRFHIGIFIVTINGSIVQKNIEAERILDATDGISLSHEEKLSLLNSADHQQLKQAIGLAVGTARAQYVRAETLMVLPRPSGADPYLVEIAPFCDDNEIETRFKGCLVFIIDPAKTDVVSTDGMQALYKLTGSESEVCKLLAQGYETEVIAEIRNLTRETVRNYIKQVLYKTGTNNRSQLVRLALNVNLPIDPVSDKK